MKNVYAAILVACLGTLGSLTVQAQNNTAYGTAALASNTTGLEGTAIGSNALSANTTGNWNTATGFTALGANTSGSGNSAFGFEALKVNIGGNYNSSFGFQALVSNTGNFNTAVGVAALSENTHGSNNTAIGEGALEDNTTGVTNTAIGTEALVRITTGSSNIAIGSGSGQYLTTSSNNIDISNLGDPSDSGTIRIGTTGTQASFYAAGINGVQISEGVPVYINSNGQLGTVNSSIRFKEDVHDMADASDKLLQLRPVTYRYKQAYEDGSKPVDYGLIAEEVAQVYPDMVARDASGEIQTVQYQKLTPMLLNEVQKEHRQLEAQQQTIQMLEQRLSKLETAAPSDNNTIAMAGK